MTEFTYPENIDSIQNKAKNRLDLLRAPDKHGIFASRGTSFEFAVFGRDSIEVAEDLLNVEPSLSKEILFAMARLQGRESNYITEEEIGKIHHEYRVRCLGELAINKSSVEILDKLGPRWGGTKERLCYYGTIDATPLFVRLVGRYIDQYGSGILDETVKDEFENEGLFGNYLAKSVNWIKNKVEQSPWGMLEFKRTNPNGLPYQAWKDSSTAYMHEDGTFARPDTGIASIEVQGYAYDSLITASKIGIFSSEESKVFENQAKKLQKNVLKCLWMDDKKYFAMGLDRDDYSNIRQIKTFTSNAASLLDSNLLINLNEEDRKKYVEPIVAKAMSEDFLTDVGIRSRALKHIDKPDNVGYHGSFVSWPKDTYDIAKGMRRHGYNVQADNLEKRLLKATEKSKEFYEYYYIDKSGKVIYDYNNQESIDELKSAGIPSTPEPGQAWTVTAILAITHNSERRKLVENAYL